MRLSSSLSILAIVLALTGCGGTRLPDQGLRSGLTIAELGELVGRRATRKTNFTLAGQSDTKYTVLEYYLAPAKTSPELRYWFLFGARGLIGYGSGGANDAKSLAYDTYFGWLADHDVMPRAEAERRLLDRLTDLYKERLNPLLASYFRIRIAVMEKVDRNELQAAKAEDAIRREFGNRLGTRQHALVYGREAGNVDRYTTLSRIGMDVRWSASVRRPGAAAGNPLISCRRPRAAGGAGVRCPF